MQNLRNLVIVFNSAACELNVNIEKFPPILEKLNLIYLLAFILFRFFINRQNKVKVSF